MKRTFLLLFTLVVMTMGDINYETVVERMAYYLQMTKDEAQICFNKANITVEDLTNFNAKEDFQTTHFDNTSLKMGCLFACLGQKKEMMTGAQINANKIKEILRSVTEPDEKTLERVDQAVNLCANQVTTNNNECEVALRFVLCMNLVGA